jgi:hypothetical protein
MVLLIYFCNDSIFEMGIKTCGSKQDFKFHGMVCQACLGHLLARPMIG